MVLGLKGPGRVGRRRFNLNEAGAWGPRTGGSHVSTVAIVLIAVGALMLLFFVGGYVASRRRVSDPALEEKIAAADRALEHARASDRGWERANLERAALDALASQQPGGKWDEVALVLV